MRRFQIFATCEKIAIEREFLRIKMNKKPKGNSAFLLENEKIDENTFQIMFGTDVHLGHQEMISVNSHAIGMSSRVHTALESIM